MARLGYWICDCCDKKVETKPGDRLSWHTVQLAVRGPSVCDLSLDVCDGCSGKGWAHVMASAASKIKPK